MYHLYPQRLSQSLGQQRADAGAARVAGDRQAVGGEPAENRSGGASQDQDARVRARGRQPLDSRAWEGRMAGHGHGHRQAHGQLGVVDHRFGQHAQVFAGAPWLKGVNFEAVGRPSFYGAWLEKH